MRRLPALAVILLLLSSPGFGEPSELDCPHPSVPAETLQESIGSISDYNTAAITNQTRFIAELLFSLADDPRLAEAGVFQIDPSTFIDAWLQATRLPPDNVPESMAAVLQYGQRFVVSIVPEPQPLIRGGPPVRRMLKVRIEWPDENGEPSHYTLEDRLSDPDVLLHHSRIITYSLIDFGEFVAFENIQGIAGRPTSGALGALFSLMGAGEIRSTRFATAGDGMQVNRSHIRKIVGFNAVATIHPDGTAERGTPASRSDLRALEQVLAADLDVRAASPSPRPCF
jgi:hypothetical protein